LVPAPVKAEGFPPERRIPPPRSGADWATTQQDKMKVCNTEAGDKKGEERKMFMSECLKADKKS
jgi:hypothetical protein